MGQESWKLIGFDTFESAWYELEGDYANESQALEAAQARLRYLEETQPSATSGGQADEGIQDRVYVVCPDRSRYRVMPAGHERDVEDSEKHVNAHHDVNENAEEGLAARLNCALRLEDEGDLAGALGEYRAALRVDDDVWHGYFLQGLALLRAEKYREACWSLRNAESRGGRLPDLYAALVTALQRLGRATDAIQAAINGVAANPNSAQMHFTLGCVLASEGRWEPAVESLEEAVRCESTEESTAQIWGKLGAAYCMVRRYQEADRAFAAADRLQPGVLGELEVQLWLEAQRVLGS
jgi:tetratricopeptide (TPR) repeat protein